MPMNIPINAAGNGLPPVGADGVQRSFRVRGRQQVGYRRKSSAGWNSPVRNGKMYKQPQVRQRPHTSQTTRADMYGRESRSRWVQRHHLGPQKSYRGFGEKRRSLTVPASQVEQFSQKHDPSSQAPKLPKKVGAKQNHQNLEDRLATKNNQSWDAPSPLRVPSPSPGETGVPTRSNNFVAGGGAAAAAARRRAAGARPSTTPVGARRGKMARSLALGVGLGYGSLEDDKENDDKPVSPASLKKQNKSLKIEIRQMKDMLLNGLRGNGRFISGGQFRMNKQGKGSGEVLRGGDIDLELRNIIKTLKSEVQELRKAHDADEAELKAAHNACAKLEGQLGDAAQKHEIATKALLAAQQQATRDSTKITWLREQYSGKERQVSLQQAQISKMEQEISTQAIEINRLLTMVNRKASAEQKPSPVETVNMEELESMRKKIKLLEKQLKDSQENASNLKVSNKTLSGLNKSLEENLGKETERANAAESAKSKLLEENAELRRFLADQSTQIDQITVLQQTIKTLRNALNEREKNVDVEKGSLDKLQARLKELESELENAKQRDAAARDACQRLRSELEKEKSKAQEMLSSAQKRFEQDLNLQAKSALEAKEKALFALQKEYDAKLLSVDRQRIALESLLQSEKDSSNKLKSQVKRLEQQLAKLEKDLQGRCEELRTCKNYAEKQMDRSKKLSKSVPGPGETHRSVQNCVKGFEAKLGKMFKENRALEESTKEITERSQEMVRKVQSDAMEATLQSLVRLCVVAPTVNVHLGNEDMDCRSSMPHDVIRNLIEREILPRFSKIFVQSSEGTAPDGTKLDSWLEGMLGEMQGAIEGHLREVFN